MSHRKEGRLERNKFSLENRVIFRYVPGLSQMELGPFQFRENKNKFRNGALSTTFCYYQHWCTVFCKSGSNIRGISSRSVMSDLSLSASHNSPSLGKNKVWESRGGTEECILSSLMEGSLISPSSSCESMFFSMFF